MNGINLRRALLAVGLCLVLGGAGLQAGSGVLAQGGGVTAQLGTDITYQGYLTDGGAPANGSYDLRFTLYDAPLGGAPLTASVDSEDVAVNGGLFSVLLDFGRGMFVGEARYLEVSVRPGSSSGAYGTLTPRQALTAAPYALALPGLWTQPNATSPNLVGGYGGNAVSELVVGGVIGGGGNEHAPNQLGGAYASVGGGLGNAAQGGAATIGGGDGNVAYGSVATIGGGQGNTTDEIAATIGGGQSNAVHGFAGTVAGGYGNQATADYATISGGGRTILGRADTGNRATDDYGAIGGGGDNQAGDADEVSDDAIYATVAGGRGNTAAGSHSTVGGGLGNVADGQNTMVGGGVSNLARGDYATVGGGGGNAAAGERATVSGGSANSAGGSLATVGGGGGNSANGSHASVGGGDRNAASGDWATIGGGLLNAVTGNNGAVGGGYGNAAGESATVAGGIYNAATGAYATVSGGDTNAARGAHATVSGGSGNSAAGDYGQAAGRRASAAHQGAFVWADSSDAALSSGAADQFLVRASGGIWLGATTVPFTPTIAPGVFVSTTTGAYLSSDGAWVNVSDRRAKAGFEPVDGESVLQALAALPISTWRYRAEPRALTAAPSARHMGPTAQDFAAAFGLGDSAVAISTVDADGVALAALQALDRRVRASEAEAASLRTQVDTLTQQNVALEARLSALEERATRPAASADASAAGRGRPGSLLRGWGWLAGGLLAVLGMVGYRGIRWCTPPAKPRAGGER